MPARIAIVCSVVLACLGLGAEAQASRVPGFGPAVRISPPLPHPHYSDPSLAARDGRTLAVWTKSRIGTMAWVQAAELDARGRPGPVASIVASPDSGFTNDPSAALSSAGKAVVVWDGGPDFVGVDARLSVFDADLTPGPLQTLGKGFDPVVRYPRTGDGLIAWSGTDGVEVAAIDPSGHVGTPSTIPTVRGYAPETTIAFDRDGGHLYFHDSSGVFEASVNGSGEPGPARELLPALGANGAYRNLVISGDLLVTLQQRVRGRRLLCLPLSGGDPRVIDRGSLRIDSIDVDVAGRRGLIGWAKSLGGHGSRQARVATVDRQCRVSRTSALPAAGRRAYDVSVGHDGRSPFALVAGGGGLEAVGLSRSGRVRGSERVRRTKPFSKKLEQRTPVTGLQLLTGPGAGPTAVWTQSHRGPGEAIAASIVR